MSSHPHRPLQIKLTVEASQSDQLLTGLDTWLQLGLITDEQVRSLSRWYLICNLPEVVSPVTPSTELAKDLVPEVVTPQPQTNLVISIWQAFKDEFSVRWLLFLGVFLVVLSSGVFTITQWQRFPAFLQYGILWLYTVVFWGVGFWTSQQAKLQLTARTLQTVALLLVPLNFWAIDSFNLWGNPFNWLVIAFAAISLSWLTLGNRLTTFDDSKLLRINLLGLSFLHWGWQISLLPLIAVYLGMIGTAIVVRRQPKHLLVVGEEVIGEQNNNRIITEISNQQKIEKSEEESTEIILKKGSRKNFNKLLVSKFHQKNNQNIGLGVVIYGLVVLLVRAIFIHHLHLPDLGLAIGTCGWLFTGLGLRDNNNQSLESSYSPAKIWQTTGCFLLFLGWLVSVPQSFPWQAILVSLLALQFFAQSLLTNWLRRDLVIIFAVILQLILLLPHLLPLELQQQLSNVIITIFQAEKYPETIYGVTLLPFLIAWISFSDWLRHQPHRKISQCAEGLGILLGIILLIISAVNPTTRSLNLIFSTITLAIVTQRRQPFSIPLIYATNIFGLLAFNSTIDWFVPNLSYQAWTIILLALMVAQWSLSILEFYTANSPRKQTWYLSCWHLGLVLASLSYFLLLNLYTTQPWGAVWLITPVSLTIIAVLTRNLRRQQSAWLSIMTLVMVQILTLWQPSMRLISLGMATGLMIVNTHYLRHQVAAVINIGFGLSFTVALLWGNVNTQDWFLVGALAIILLWLMGSLLKQKDSNLANLYSQATDSWAILICAGELSTLTLKSILSYIWIVPAAWVYLVSALFTFIALTLRYWRQPNRAAIYGLTWTGEIILAEATLLAGGFTLQLATANIILALLTLWLTNWLVKFYTQLSTTNTIILPEISQRTQELTETVSAKDFDKRSIQRASYISTLQELPLIYAILGVGLRSGHFTPYTGLLTLGAAITALVVGNRRPQGKIISYLALVSISLGIYELVIYQLQQAHGGSPDDGITILAIVSAAIALVYRLLVWFNHQQGRQQIFNLNLDEIKTTAHLHWALGSILKIIGVGMALETTPRLTPLGITVSAFLGLYALIQARQSQSDHNRYNDWWVYVGLVELVGTSIYARLIWTELALLDPWRVLAACFVALGIYQIPWRSWGWNSRPWQRATVAFPALTALLTSQDVSLISLLAVAVFYGTIAKRQSNIRWTFISLIFVDWVIVRWLMSQQLSDPLWYATILGLSLLYIAQLEPNLRETHNRQMRHQLRMFSMGIICVTAMVLHQDTGIIPAVIALAAIFSGLGLQIRAFLFVGTFTFLLTVTYQLIILSFEYPFSKWMIGLLAGIMLITIAANFERRREQIIDLLRNWLEQLNQWQ